MPIFDSQTPLFKWDNLSKSSQTLDLANSSGVWSQDIMNNSYKYTLNFRISTTLTSASRDLSGSSTNEPLNPCDTDSIYKFFGALGSPVKC